MHSVHDLLSTFHGPMTFHGPGARGLLPNAPTCGLRCVPLCAQQRVGVYRTDTALRGPPAILCSKLRDYTPGLVTQQSFNGRTCPMWMGGSILNIYSGTKTTVALYPTHCVRGPPHQARRP